MFVVDKLLKPLHYVQISSTEKRWFDFGLPLVFATISILIIYVFLPQPLSFIGKDSVISLSNGILQILSGFYIASMAAVSTFNREGMDDLMEGSDIPMLRGEPLSRRSFLSYLFGYLAFMSIVMYFAGGLAQLASGTIHSFCIEHPYGKVALATLYLLVLWNILFTTVLGMHFLIDRIHRSKPKMIIKDGQKD
ncbi:hypothetical protein H9X88_24310 [Aeromonas hydrophila]|uniref:hypothetical protein n=1 Tax=Aeromonas hydrophila TaxID=644 RepID=UPI001B3A086D|nr:hypothetical protein [Aeromonas hydrophila]MBQ4676137.1 hypothetical protein [Aeromonas hydrophila]MBW3814104.1 hypothetical protein [Aeromonas hydrophila]MCF7681197.1 hypothetical protein [Aeromonas hydrophila]MCF7694105.1 hypothetical protein [Aeromonas hydrophila]MCF7774976.1 hypothetical protein [Aeromonas hydrophila]